EDEQQQAEMQSHQGSPLTFQQETRRQRERSQRRPRHGPLVGTQTSSAIECSPECNLSPTPNDCQAYDLYTRTHLRINKRLTKARLQTALLERDRQARRSMTRGGALAWERSAAASPTPRHQAIVCRTTSKRICRPRRRLSIETRSSWPWTVRRSCSVASTGEKPYAGVP